MEIPCSSSKAVIFSVFHTENLSIVRVLCDLLKLPAEICKKLRDFENDANI